jgi:hypothetical protein
MVDPGVSRSRRRSALTLLIVGGLGLLLGAGVFTGSTPREWWLVAIGLQVGSFTAFCGGIGWLMGRTILGLIVGFVLVAAYWVNAIVFVGMC